MSILDFMKNQQARPDFADFVRVIRGEQKTRRVHYAELLVDREFIDWMTEHVFDETPVPLTMKKDQPICSSMFIGGTGWVMIIV